MSTVNTLSENQIFKLKENILIEKIAYLCDDVGDPGRYFPELRSKSILSTTDTDSIRNKTTDREKTEEFVTLMSKRRDASGRHAFDVFVDALKNQRVHAHVARTLQRAFNKKKAEALKTTTPLATPQPPPSQVGGPRPPASHSPANTPGSSETDRNSTTSSQPDYHPIHGLLPTDVPPSSASEHSRPDSMEGDLHPQYGLRPNPPPSSNNDGFVSPKQADMSQHRPHLTSDVNGHYGDYRDPPHFSDELAGQSMASTDTSLSTLSTASYQTDDFMRSKAPPSHTSSASSSTERSSLPSLGSIEDPVYDWRKEKNRLEYNLHLAIDRVRTLEIENKMLREQLMQHRPSNLAVGAHPHHQSRADYYSSPALGAPGRHRHLSPSPGTVGERESPGIRSAISSGSLNYQSPRGGYNPSESQV